MYFAFMHRILIVELHHEVNAMVEAGATDEEILRKFAHRIPEMQRLIEIKDKVELEAHLQQHYSGCLKYMQIMEEFADRIKAGEFESTQD